MSSPSAYKIPIVDLRAQYRTIQPEIRAAIDEVMESQQFILGPAARRFEDEMAAYLSCGSAIGVASGSDALLLALMALEIGRGDAVIVPPFTFFSTVSSITRLGATPIFIDIDPESYLLAPSATRDFIEQRCRPEGRHLTDSKSGLHVKALLPVHLFGRSCAMADFLPLAKQYSLRVVEDVAQAFGARVFHSGQSKLAGTFGDLGCFSFFPSKTLGGYGDGGSVISDQTALAEKVRTLRMHGENIKYHHRVIGINSRLDAIQAAVLSVKLRHLDDWCKQRVERAKTYHRLFSETGLMGDKILRTPAPTEDLSHVFNNYVIRALRRDELKHFLAEQGIQTEVYYPLPLHLQECFLPLGYAKGEFPHAELAATQVLALPIYPELTEAQQAFIVGKIEEFFRS